MLLNIIHTTINNDLIIFFSQRNMYINFHIDFRVHTKFFLIIIYVFVLPYYHKIRNFCDGMKN